MSTPSCPKCGATQSAGATQCPYCGNALPPPAPPQAFGAAGGYGAPAPFGAPPPTYGGPQPPPYGSTPFQQGPVQPFGGGHSPYVVHSPGGGFMSAVGSVGNALFWVRLAIALVVFSIIGFASCVNALTN